MDPLVCFGVGTQQLQRAVPGAVIDEKDLCLQPVGGKQLVRCFLNFLQEIREGRLLVIAGDDDR